LMGEKVTKQGQKFKPPEKYDDEKIEREIEELFKKRDAPALPQLVLETTDAAAEDEDDEGKSPYHTNIVFAHLDFSRSNSNATENLKRLL
uniref:Secretogranin-3 n=1 Tax=Gongylonema pulchrum TaxID=637853 RepID=A0A183D5A0_9BILA